jgi:hypothetical protein
VGEAHGVVLKVQGSMLGSCAGPLDLSHCCSTWLRGAAHGQQPSLVADAPATLLQPPLWPAHGCQLGT